MTIIHYWPVVDTRLCRSYLTALGGNNNPGKPVSEKVTDQHFTTRIIGVRNLALQAMKSELFSTHDCSALHFPCAYAAFLSIKNFSEKAKPCIIASDKDPKQCKLKMSMITDYEMQVSWAWPC